MARKTAKAKTPAKQAKAESTKKTRARKRPLPGDAATPDVASMIRVNHAGEYGAKRIYQGQLAVLGHDKRLRALLEHMAEQEQEHLSYFEKQIAQRRVRPSFLQPLWHVAGYAAGALTARIGTEAAMACTVAVETAISEHYGEQVAALGDEESDLKKHIARFKAEEEEHHDIGIENDAELAPQYKLLKHAIMAGTKLAIAVAKRI